MTVRSGNVFFGSVYFGKVFTPVLPLDLVTLLFLKSLYFSWTQYFVYLNLSLC